MRAHHCFYATCIVAVCLSVACWNSEAPESADHDHGSHGGHLIDLAGGDGYRAELYFDAQTDKLVLQTLGRDGLPKPADAVPVQMTLTSGRQKLAVEMNPRQLATEPEGRSSRFECDLTELPQQLRVEQHFTADFILTVAGQKVTGRLVHTADHGHSFSHD
jgi:hypothetical protein